MSIDELYAQPILQLAREARDRAPVQRPTAGATVLSNRFCGDEVRLDVRVDEGLIRGRSLVRYTPACCARSRQ